VSFKPGAGHSSEFPGNETFFKLLEKLLWRHCCNFGVSESLGNLHACVLWSRDRNPQAREVEKD
jgi:hypothetical protein